MRRQGALDAEWTGHLTTKNKDKDLTYRGARSERSSQSAQFSVANRSFNFFDTEGRSLLTPSV